jgi:hypothetical protein
MDMYPKGSKEMIGHNVKNKNKNQNVNGLRVKN